MNTYEEALKWIHSRLRFGMKPGLQRMNALLKKLHHPEEKVKAVHIGGTNGKGSTLTYMRAILHEAGYDVGSFTSPYIETFNERISVNGQPIGDLEILNLVKMIKPIVEEVEKEGEWIPTEFEIITAMCFYYFANVQKVDILLLEVGLGGRLDSTNVVVPELSIITSIGLDHTQILGNSLKEIAEEKAGIIKPGVPIITCVKQQSALEVIRERSLERKASLFSLKEDFFIKDYYPNDSGETFSYQSSSLSIENLSISMHGEHQVENASLAIKSIEWLVNYSGFQISENQIRAGLAAAYWPVRMEILSYSPMVLVDGAHNPEGISALRETLLRKFSQKHISVLFAALADKEVSPMIEDLKKVTDRIVLTTFDFPRAPSLEQLSQIAEEQHTGYSLYWKEYLEGKISEMGEDDLLVITGSLYFLSEVKPLVVELLEK
ncbi:bifunctional folylpolyglutamate synthase/dihydrofolate synthase [Bacillus sp. 2205SS5-2]|uniref:bifunctional folylpolyglutamate synthase/dihydrofolate synthase n=1 Tax=Bacillus sp. 2205SS5-2 TaxID=3109031 RepID=UPI00300441F8